MTSLYEERRVMPRPRTTEEALRVRMDRERHYRMMRKRRAWIMRAIFIGVALVLIVLEIVHADIIVAGSAVWACIPGE